MPAGTYTIPLEMQYILSVEFGAPAVAMFQTRTGKETVEKQSIRSFFQWQATVAGIW